jgi:hypothetical protein
MKYYKVSEKMDQKRFGNGYFYIAGELFTEKQANRIGANISLLDAVEISQRKTYWFFGARFAMND